MLNVEIRHATAADVPDIAPLFDAYRVWYGASSDPDKARQFLTQRITNNESTVFLAVSDGRGVGFTQLYPLFSSISMEPIWLLNDLFVIDGCRGQGLGSMLLQTSAQFATEVGAIRLELDTARTNLQAQALYERLGWQRDDEFHQFVLNLNSC